jgi:hypothetical protein
MIHVQQPETLNTSRAPAYYTYCGCGVCGPLRASRDAAGVDERGHESVCSERQAA